MCQVDIEKILNAEPVRRTAIEHLICSTGGEDSYQPDEDPYKPQFRGVLLRSLYHKADAVLAIGQVIREASALIRLAVSHRQDR